ncbi:hypothetical protein PF003_g16901 [Phytophthora fragariae]|nr:hypothetical protein PF003_g16901 [Phytophthora fragariae]
MPKSSSLTPTPLSSPSLLPLFHEGSPEARPAKVLRSQLLEDSRLKATPRSKRRLSTGDAEDEPPRRRSKLSLSAAALTSPLPWLRSGRRFSHPLVLEAVTMQVSSLSEFQLVPRAEIDEVGSEVSSQRTETVPSSPASPATSVATTDALRSPSLISSQVSTVAPWTPQRDDRTPPPSREEFV